MTGGAHLGIPAPEPIRIEPRAVRIEAATALSGVAGQTIPLGVTGNAGLDVLARGNAVIEGEAAVGVMEAHP
jgi:hypothetical protein